MQQRKINNEVTSNKTRYAETENNLSDHINSYIKLINHISREIKLISKKGLKKDSINGYSIFYGEKFVTYDGSQSYLRLQPALKYFKMSTNSDRIIAWKSKVLSKESIKPGTLENSLVPRLNFNGTKIRVKFGGSCLKEGKSF